MWTESYVFFYILVGFYLLWEVQLAIQSGFIQHFLYKEKSVRKSRIWHLFSIGFIYLFLQFNFLWSSLFLLFNFLKGYKKYPFCVDFLHLANFGEGNVRFRALSVYFQGYSKTCLPCEIRFLRKLPYEQVHSCGVCAGNIVIYFDRSHHYCYNQYGIF